MQTTIRVDQRNRDALARIAAQRGGSSHNDALTILLFEHDSLAAIAALEADPAALADYQRDAERWAELDSTVDDA